MVKLGLISALVWAAGLAVAAPSPAPLVGVQTRNVPGMTDEDTLHLLWRRIATAAHLQRRNVFTGNATLEKSWNDFPLFHYEYSANKTTEKFDAQGQVSIEISCSTCYLKANATAALTVDGDFSLKDTIHNITGQFKDELKNVTESAMEGLANSIHWPELIDLIGPGDFEMDQFINLNNFTVDTDIDIDLPPLPEVQLLFQIDNLDLYVELDTTIAASATLHIPLYKSQSEFGITIAPGLEAGIFVTMDLILSAEGEIDIRSGFHLLIEDPIGFNIALFGQDVSSIIFNGGKFEFLPVTIVSGSIALKAVLRLGMHAGFETGNTVLLELARRSPLVNLATLVVPKEKEQKLEEDLKITYGVEVGVFAHVAEFLTNITFGDKLEELEHCKLKIVEEYTMALGAAGGATVAFGPHTWGPQPNTSIPIFYTTLAEACAHTSSAKTTAATTTAANALAGRQDLVTHTTTTKIIQTGIACVSPQLPACPQSLQTTTLLTSTQTLTALAAAGADPTFPTATALTVASTIPFGKSVNKLAATSGVPTSYVPPPPPPPPASSTSSAGGDHKDGGGDILDNIGDVFHGETGGVSNKLIIGLSVGLGVPIVAAAIASLIHFCRRRRYAPVPKSDTAVEYTGGYQSPMAAERESMVKKSPDVSTSEVGH